mmetsp:Transcript_73274/g.184594  ORF Transcript_73274/g.184594 Transcript_73274/m.184594 type:complete len:235 (-) Transcript_73274:281-985(-)
MRTSQGGSPTSFIATTASPSYSALAGNFKDCHAYERDVSHSLSSLQSQNKSKGSIPATSFKESLWSTCFLNLRSNRALRRGETEGPSSSFIRASTRSPRHERLDAFRRVPCTSWSSCWAAACSNFFTKDSLPLLLNIFSMFFASRLLKESIAAAKSVADTCGQPVRNFGKTDLIEVASRSSSELTSKSNGFSFRGFPWLLSMFWLPLSANTPHPEGEASLTLSSPNNSDHVASS